mmetsp:Transcript_3679/g.10728  ORF Transcript_3679/g.10728 Transcript_3679/m.10728 type:complete len:217 (+) Transcript_3679:573-1223(+)
MHHQHRHSGDQARLRPAPLLRRRPRDQVDEHDERHRHGHGKDGEEDLRELQIVAHDATIPCTECSLRTGRARDVRRVQAASAGVAAGADVLVQALEDVQRPRRLRPEARQKPGKLARALLDLPAVVGHVTADLACHPLGAQQATLRRFQGQVGARGAEACLFRLRSGGEGLLPEEAHLAGRLTLSVLVLALGAVRARANTLVRRVHKPQGRVLREA